MPIISIEDLMKKKQERERIRKLVCEGKSSVDSYTALLEEHIAIQDEYIQSLQDLVTAQQELISAYQDSFQDQSNRLQ